MEEKVPALVHKLLHKNIIRETQVLTSLMWLQVSLDERIQIEQEKLWNEQKKINSCEGDDYFRLNFNMEFVADDFDRTHGHYWENTTIAKITAID